MAQVDDIEFYGRAVAAGEMELSVARDCLVEASQGGLTAVGAEDCLNRWQDARGLYRRELDRAVRGLEQM
jgi:hypothetical protein